MHNICFFSLFFFLILLTTIKRLPTILKESFVVQSVHLYSNKHTKNPLDKNYLTVYLHLSAQNQMREALVTTNQATPPLAIPCVTLSTMLNPTFLANPFP